MKFSVLIPTRNRLEYLRFAVASVLKQDYQNWELIISDNFSEEDIKGYVNSLNDPRIKYFRTSSFVTVTDNWNNALENSTGDYVIMLGDDDCLLNNYFTTCLQLLETNALPDVLYSSAYNYVYPKVLQGAPNGYLITWENASFLSGKTSPYILNKDETFELVKKTLNFNVMFNFNVQFSLVSRSLIEKMKKYGPFYQSPYPDYYATTAIMLKADRVLAVPDRLVVVGITPKSFGYYYFNNLEKVGVEMLNNVPQADLFSKMEKILLPGTNLNSSWLYAMETIQINFGKEYKLKTNYKKYRFLQVLYVYKRYACCEGLKLQDIMKVIKKLWWWEKLVYFIPFHIIASIIRFHPNKTFGKSWAAGKLYAFSHPSHGVPTVHKMQFSNILEVFEQDPRLSG